MRFKKKYSKKNFKRSKKGGKKKNYRLKGYGASRGGIRL